jgi:riboflavin kinase/FMN adenylyltransferase
MEVIKSSKFSSKDIHPVAIAIGAFDGLHIGHQTIINKTIKKAKEANICSGVYSFNPHPAKIIKPEQAPSYLISFNQKINILEKLGVDYYFEQKFTLKFSKMNFEKFIYNIILGELNAKHIVVGYDFKFGHQGSGNIDSLRKLGKKYNFKVTVLKPVKVDTCKISSSKIRRLIKKGKIEEIPSYLGRNYQLEGKVIYGEGRGQKIGIPTANLKLKTDYTLPPQGVYAAYVYYNNKKYKAITNFGVKPTFNKNGYSIEIHLMNFSGNIYGATLIVDLISFIRMEMAFDSPTKLVNQIKKDILYTDKVLC